MNLIRIILVLLVLLPKSAHAQDWVGIGHLEAPVELQGSLLLTRDNGYDLDEVISGQYDAEFVAEPFDFETETYWGLIYLDVESTGTYYLSTIHAFNKQLGYLVSEDSVIYTSQTGYDFPLKERSWQRENATAHIMMRFDKPGRYKYYIKFVTTFKGYRQYRNMEKPQLYSEYLFDSYILGGHLIGGIYIGISVLAFFMNLIWFILTRNRVNLYFLLFVLSGFIYKTVTSGYITEWFFAENTIIPTQLRNIFPTFFGAFYILFCLEFIQAEKNFPKARKILLGILAVYVIQMPFFIYFQPILVHLVSRAIFDNVILIFLAVLVIMTFSKKYDYPRLQHTFFSVGVLIYFFGSLIFLVYYMFSLFPGIMIFKFYFSIMASLRETCLFIGTAYGFVHNEKLLAIENRTNARIKEQNRELEALNNKNQKILSLVTHDIKNPLFSLEIALNTLGEKGLKMEEFQKITSSLKNSVGNTSAMLENVLSWAKEQELDLKPRMEALLLTEVIDDSIELVKPLAEHKHIALHFTMDQDHTVLADEEMLKSIIRNLLTNAIKFSPENTRVDLSVSVQGDQVKISIKDGGIGLSPSQIQQILSHDNSSPQPVRSGRRSGLGLILVQDFIKKLNSELTITSQEGSGSEFAFFLEVAR